MRGPVQHKRLQKPDHILASEWHGRLKYNSAADAAQDFPEIIMIEDFLTGFIKGASSAYSTSNSTADSTCTTAMSGIVVSFFDLLANREIYNPAKSIKAVIAFKDLQENQAVFYAYCDFSHLYSVLAELTSFSDMKQYGQLIARVLGLLIDDSKTALPCISDGLNYRNGKDFYDVGLCGGQVFSQVLDAKF
jgi:hypothetical protein